VVVAFGTTGGSEGVIFMTTQAISHCSGEANENLEVLAVLLLDMAMRLVEVILTPFYSIAIM
jgi:hypothetical protein